MLYYLSAVLTILRYLLLQQNHCAINSSSRYDILHQTFSVNMEISLYSSLKAKPSQNFQKPSRHYRGSTAMSLWIHRYPPQSLHHTKMEPSRSRCNRNHRGFNHKLPQFYHCNAVQLRDSYRGVASEPHRRVTDPPMSHPRASVVPPRIRRIVMVESLRSQRRTPAELPRSHCGSPAEPPLNHHGVIVQQGCGSGSQKRKQWKRHFLRARDSGSRTV